MTVTMERRARRPAGTHEIPQRGDGGPRPRRTVAAEVGTVISLRATRPTRRRSTFLVVLHGQREGAVFELAVGRPCSIGRGRRADVCLEDEGVSRIHARVVLDPEGTVRVVDERSTNGTFVNGCRVDAEILRDGDRIRVGPTTVLGVCDSHPGEGTGSRLRDAALGGGPGGAATTVEVCRHSLRQQEGSLGPEHLGLVETLEALGAALLEHGSVGEAELHLGRALRILEQHPSASASMLGRIHHRMGKCALVRGRPTLAVEHLERAQALLLEHEPGSAVLAEVWFSLARALRVTGALRRAVMMAQLALGACQGGEGPRSLQASIGHWLGDHGDR